MKLISFLRAIVLASGFLIHLAGHATAQNKGEQDLVRFVSPTTVSFPLATDGLDVAPVRFPFVAFGGKDPARIAAAVVSVTRDGGTAILPSFTARMVAPSANQPLYSLEIDAVGDKVIPAGKYDVAVYLWQKPTDGNIARPKTGTTADPQRAANQTFQMNPENLAHSAPTASLGVDCAGCQTQTFSITREAVTLELEGSSLLVPVLWRGEITANLLETGNKSSGALSLQAVSAKLGENGPVRTVQANLGGDEIARGSAQTVVLSGATSLPIGTWNTTLRIRSDQFGAAGEVTKTLTIVRKIASWVLLLAIVLGILTGWFVRDRLAQKAERAAANAAGEKLAARLREIGNTIGDGAFKTIRLSALDEIEKAIAGNGTPGDTRALAQSLTVKLEENLADYKAREQAERHKLSVLLDAIEGIVARVPGLSDPLAALSNRLDTRLALVEETLVDASEAKGAADDIVLAIAGEMILDWARAVSEGLVAMQAMWPQPTSIPGSLTPAQTAADELAALAPESWADWAKALADASALAERLKSNLSNVWLPAVQFDVAAIGARNISEPERTVVYAATAALARAVETARAKGRVLPELVDATRVAAEARAAALATQVADMPGAQPAAVVDPGAGPDQQPQPIDSWNVGGPASVMAGTANTWHLQSSKILRGNWFVDGKIVAVDKRSFSYRFEKTGVVEINVQVDRASSKRLMVAVTEGAVRPSETEWRNRSDNIERLRMGVSAVLITLAGFFVLQSSFANWGDVFAGFFWGFSANISMEGLLSLRAQLKVPVA